MSPEIRWREWGAEAFEEARRDDKPILLSIGAVWCHWCHVMDRTSYSDPEVAAAIERAFVPVRVDTDRRPDVNARYNLGGWPTTALLTPDGEVLTGATYVPPADMRRLLNEVSEAYRTHRAQIEHDLKERMQRVRERSPQTGGALDESILATTREAIVATYDAGYGGFGDAPKFPQTPSLDFLLLLHERSDDTECEAIVVKTLLAMARGGMYDHAEGGFFRYSTTRDWTVPHFEKMAADHAGLLPLYARAWQRFGIPALRETLVHALGYVRRVFRDPHTGLFAGSQDADETYYAFPLEQRKEREAPFVDRTVYTDLSAGLAGALLRCAHALEDDAIAAEGMAALDALAQQMRAESGLYFHYRRIGGEPELPNLLGDQITVLRANLDAHELSGEPRFRVRAAGLAERIVVTFSDFDGTLVDHANDETFGRMGIRDHPLDENAAAADAFLRLAAMTGDEALAARARGMLEAFATSYAAARSFAAPYGSAVMRALSGGTTVVLIARDDSSELREAALRLPDPFVTVATFAHDDPSAGMRGFDAPQSGTRAYLCRGTTCSAPVDTASELRDAYDRLKA